MPNQHPVPDSARRYSTAGAVAAPVVDVHDGTTNGDRRLAVIASVCIALSLAGVLVHAVGLLSAPVAVTMVLLPVGVGLRVALTFAGRAASSVRRTQVMTLVSSVGLGISALTLVSAVPHLTRAGGVGKFGADVFAHGWTLAIVTIAVGSVRTLGWRAFVGTGLMGFLAVPAIAALIGRPVVSHLGTNSGLASAGWAPLTEESLKALPVLLIAVLAARRRAIQSVRFQISAARPVFGVRFRPVRERRLRPRRRQLVRRTLASLLARAGQPPRCTGAPGCWCPATCCTPVCSPWASRSPCCTRVFGSHAGHYQLRSWWSSPNTRRWVVCFSPAAVVAAPGRVKLLADIHPARLALDRALHRRLDRNRHL